VAGEKQKLRLTYIDWMRGLACLTMFQTHCYDSWLAPAERTGAFFKWSQLVGTLPAPLFLFLAGVSFALVTDKMRRRGMSDNEIARKTIKRGAEIFGIAMLFRVQEYVLGLPWAPWTDLLRVDILNMMGISMMAMGLLCRVVRTPAASALAAIGLSLAIALATPPLWTTLRPRWLPWPLESYLNGVHTYPEPQPWLFPIFPWSAIAFVGLAVGFFLFSDWAKRREARTVALLGASGFGMYHFSQWLDARPVQLYAVYDYWHTSPNFCLARVGILLMILLFCYAWCRWGAGEWGFSPMIQLGQTSLLVYWVHIEFVYGRFSILAKRGVTIEKASLGLLVVFVAMLLLSMARTRLKGRGAEVFSWLRRAARPAQEG